MAGLVLKMAPKERVLINGAVLENGDKRSRFSIVTPSANVLRLKDAISPDQANTPVGRLCFQLQLILAGNADADSTKPQITDQIDLLRTIFKDKFSGAHLDAAKDAIEQGKFYSALKSIKVLIPLETALLVR